ncbi:hypothetical protein GCM10027049_01490 [Mucilaginibacter puniceus]
MNKYIKIMGYRLIFIAAFLPFINYKAKAQNAFSDAITLYNWKHSKINDSLTLKKVEIILGKINLSQQGETSPVLVKIKDDFVTRSFDAQMKSGNDLYKKIIQSIKELNSSNPISKDPIVSNIRRGNDILENLNNNNATLVASISFLNNYIYDPKNKLSAEIYKAASDSCTILASDTCLKNSLKNILRREISKYSNMLDENKSQIATIQSFLSSNVKSLRDNSEILTQLKIVGFEERLANVVRLNKPESLVLNNIIKDEQQQSAMSKNATGMASYSIPSEAEMIDLVAVYLAKRVKQEALIYFVEKWRDTILKSELKNIFPESTHKFQNWQPYTVPNFDNSWKYAFSKDLLGLPKHGLDYLDNHLDIVNNDSKIYLKYLRDALTISEKVTQHYNYMEIVESLANNEKKLAELKSSGLQTFLRLAYIINEELYQTNSGENFWITSNEFFTVMQNNDELARIFISIIAKKYPDINNYLTVNVNNLSANEIGEISNWFGNVLMTLNHFQDSQRNKVGEKGFALNSYWSNLSQVINVFLEKESVIKESANYKKGLEKVNELFEVYALIQNKNYPAATNKGLNIFRGYVKEDQDNVFGPALEITSFASDILQAQNEEQLANVIESHALPPASYRLKQNFSSIITVGAYFGPYGGVEFIKDEKRSGILGFTAPISLDYSWSNKPKIGGKHKKAYTTLSLIVFDLGSVVSYRLTNEGAGLPSKARWSQLFSPGLNIRFGLGDAPLTFSIGGQLSPQLRDFNNESNKDAFRLSAGLMVDMPLILLRKGRLHKSSLNSAYDPSAKIPKTN